MDEVFEKQLYFQVFWRLSNDVCIQLHLCEFENLMLNNITYFGLVLADECGD